MTSQTCRKHQSSFSAYLDGAVSGQQMQEIARHMESCDECAREFAALRTMQQALSLAGAGGILPYPVANNRTAPDGTKYTGVVVQYLGDGIYDPHAIYSQLDAVKYQYGCFFETMWKTGKATVPAPAPYDVGCAGE